MQTRRANAVASATIPQIVLPIAACLLLILSVGCRGAAGRVSLPATYAGPNSLSATTSPALAPAAAHFITPDGVVKFTIPPGWAAGPSPDDVLTLVPVADLASPAPGSFSRQITLDVPDLPPHIPGLIPLGLVENGYVDDNRKDHPGVKVEEAGDQTWAGGKARRITLAWQSTGRRFTSIALLSVHGDRVYILSAESDADHFPAVREAFERIVSSAQWLK